MEPEALPLDKALQGIAVLALIPVVAFALWTDYIIQLQNTPEDPENSKSNEDSKRDASVRNEFEVEKIRIGSLFIILFQCTLFIGSSEIQTAFPILTQLVFMVVILLQVIAQYQAEKKLRIKDYKPDELLGIILRIGFSWLVGGVLYLGILISSVKGATMIAQTIHASPSIETLLLLSGGLLGVLLGFGLNFAFSPIYLKVMLPTSPIQESPLQKQCENCFQKAGLPLPSLRIIELTALKISDVLIAGLQKGRGPFRPALFLSRTLIDSLLPTELDAIVLNQVSHVALHHLRKRFLFSMTLIVGTGLVATLSVLIGQEFLSGQTTLEIFAPVIALASFISSFKFLALQAKKHELEADLYSIQHLGVNIDDFSNALRKLDSTVLKTSNPTVLSLSKGHPETEKRIELIKAHLAIPQEQDFERLKAS